MRIPYSYLPQQFLDCNDIWLKIREVVMRGDFTLGKELPEFERAFADYIQVPHAIGVASGTDAIFLPLKALGITGEVITPPFSFYATTASIVNAGAKPVFADVGANFNIDPKAIEDVITPQTEAIVPVHWGGWPCDMDAIYSLAQKHGLAVIEDAAQATGSKWDGRSCGAWGTAGAFSLHPLKLVNIWGDGGVITCHDSLLAEKLKRLRNHGMKDRDTVIEWGYNSRLDTIQAIVAHHMLKKADSIISKRRELARTLDAALDGVAEIEWLVPLQQEFSNYYLYTFHAQRRNELLSYLISKEIDAKVHYPVPLHLQPAAKEWGYQRGDFPMAEKCAGDTITLPLHEFISSDDVFYMADTLREFYKGT